MAVKGKRMVTYAKQAWKPGNMLYPVPAVMVSCQRRDEKPNIITVAWAGTVCSDPVMVSVSIRKERYSYDIVKESGEFVINLVTKDLVFAADYCGVRSGRDVDKFSQMKLTPLPSRQVGAPGITESPVNLECRVCQVIPLGSHDMFVAEVVGVTVDERYMDEKGKFHLNDAGLTAYSHGEYFQLGKKIGQFGYSVRKETGKKPVEEKAAAGKQGTGKPSAGKQGAGKQSTGKQDTGKPVAEKQPAEKTARRRNKKRRETKG